jgi:hypothetical protein
VNIDPTEIGFFSLNKTGGPAPTTGTLEILPLLHRSFLKGIGVQVHVYLVQRIRGLVHIHNSGIAPDGVFGSVQFHVHGVMNVLLPVGISPQDQVRQEGKQNNVK